MLLGVLASGEPFSATGGTVTTSGGYTYHTFTSVGNSTFTTNQAGLVDALIIAGGGAGGAARGSAGGGGGGGGGAGGYLYVPSCSVSNGALTVTVGAGGVGNGASGGNSVFSGQTAVGGGYGGKADDGNNNRQAAASGGSGGGSGAFGTGAGSGTSGQGFAGFNNGNNSQGGGGGGASGAASSAFGVAGRTTAGFHTEIWASGGSGCTRNVNIAGVEGGGRGGGEELDYPGATSGTRYGCGGGGSYGDYRGAGVPGNGFQGVVIIRYPTPV